MCDSEVSHSQPAWCIQFNLNIFIQGAARWRKCFLVYFLFFFSLIIFLFSISIDYFGFDPFYFDFDHIKLHQTKLDRIKSD